MGFFKATKGAKMSKVVKFFYALRDANTKELLESNAGAGELAFVSGKNQVLPGLEEELLKMSEGEKKEISIPCAQALGEYDEKLVQSLPKEQFAGIDLSVGMELFGEDASGETARVVVKEITDESVVVDFNHPYSGKDLLFEVELTELRDADADEELTGVVVMPHTCGCGGHDDGCCGGAHHDENGGGCCGKHH